jgi:hypothetical protein
MSAVVVVCADARIAGRAVAAGDHVVIIGDDGARLGIAAARLRAQGGDRCRVAVFVGDPSRALVWSTAAAMAAEQFRCEVRVEKPMSAP